MSMCNSILCKYVMQTFWLNLVSDYTKSPGSKTVLMYTANNWNYVLILNISSTPEDIRHKDLLKAIILALNQKEQLEFDWSQH